MLSGWSLIHPCDPICFARDKWLGRIWSTIGCREDLREWCVRFCCRGCMREFDGSLVVNEVVINHVGWLSEYWSPTWFYIWLLYIVKEACVCKWSNELVVGWSYQEVIIVSSLPFPSNETAKWNLTLRTLQVDDCSLLHKAWVLLFRSSEQVMCCESSPLWMAPADSQSLREKRAVGKLYLGRIRDYTEE